MQTLYISQYKNFVLIGSMRFNDLWHSGNTNFWAPITSLWIFQISLKHLNLELLGWELKPNLNYWQPIFFSGWIIARALYISSCHICICCVSNRTPLNNATGVVVVLFCSVLLQLHTATENSISGIQQMMVEINR